MTRLALVSGLSTLSQLPLLVLSAWTVALVLVEARRPDGSGTHEYNLSSLVLAGGCIFSCFLTSVGLIYWSVLEDQVRVRVRLLRGASFSSCTTGLVLVILQGLCLQLTGDVDHDPNIYWVFLGCGLVTFFLSCLTLMLSFCGEHSILVTPLVDPTIWASADADAHSSLLEPLLSAAHQGRGDELEELEEDVRDETDEAHESGVPNIDVTSRWNGTRRLLQLAAPQVSYLYAGCAVLLIRLPFSLSIPHFISTTISAIQGGHFDAALQEILYLVVAGSIDAALDFWCVFLFGYANLRIVRGVRLELFSKLIRQDMTFFDQTSTGELSSRLQSDCSEMAGDLTWFFRFSIESSVRITGITLYMFLRNPILASCALCIAPLVAVVNKLYGNWLRENAVQVQTALASANEVALEALSNIRTVIAFATEPFEFQRYEDRIQVHYQLNVKQLIMSGVYYMAISTFLVNTVVQALLLFIGSRLVQADKLTGQVLLAFMLYQGQLQNETLNLFQSYSSLIKSSGAGDKVFQLLDRKPPAPSTNSEDVMSSLGTNTSDEVTDLSKRQPYSVELKQVSYTYPSRPHQPILQRLDLMLPSGSSTAIVGSSGCGKSTICHLLQRFYDPDSGIVLVNGADLKSLDLIEYRRRIGVVSQETALFQGTILENIVYGCLGATREDAVQAARVAFADHFIMEFPHGYDTIVGERGVQLSGGQRQRISIARAVIKKPSLLLLDEATSALDTASEQVVQEAIDHLLREKSLTTVIVAHRLRTVQSADCIAVLQHGQVVELGPHDVLMLNPQGLYRSMVERAGSTDMFPVANCGGLGVPLHSGTVEHSRDSMRDSPCLKEESLYTSTKQSRFNSPFFHQESQLGSLPVSLLSQTTGNHHQRDTLSISLDSVPHESIDTVLDATIDSLLDEENDIDVEHDAVQSSS